MPAAVNRSNAKHYERSSALTEYKEYPGPLPLHLRRGRLGGGRGLRAGLGPRARSERAAVRPRLRVTPAGGGRYRAPRRRAGAARSEGRYATASENGGFRLSGKSTPRDLGLPRRGPGLARSPLRRGGTAGAGPRRRREGGGGARRPAPPPRAAARWVILPLRPVRGRLSSGTAHRLVVHRPDRAPPERKGPAMLRLTRRAARCALVAPAAVAFGSGAQSRRAAPRPRARRLHRRW